MKRGIDAVNIENMEKLAGMFDLISDPLSPYYKFQDVLRESLWGGGLANYVHHCHVSNDIARALKKTFPSISRYMETYEHAEEMLRKKYALFVSSLYPNEKIWLNIDKGSFWLKANIIENRSESMLKTHYQDMGFITLGHAVVWYYNHIHTLMKEGIKELPKEWQIKINNHLESIISEGLEEDLKQGYEYLLKVCLNTMLTLKIDIMGEPLDITFEDIYDHIEKFLKDKLEQKPKQYVRIGYCDEVKGLVMQETLDPKGEWLCLHNETREEDYEDIIKFIQEETEKGSSINIALPNGALYIDGNINGINFTSSEKKPIMGMGGASSASVHKNK